jgi:hypothetical protein
MFYTLCKGTFRLQKKSSAPLQTEHQSLQNLSFLIFFFFFESHLVHLNTERDPDPATQTNPDPCDIAQEYSF